MIVSGKLGRSDSHYTVDYDVGESRRTELYPNDVLSISFDDADDVQISIDKNDRLYVELVTYDGDCKKIYIS